MSRILYCAEPIDQSDFGPWKESVAQFCSIATARGWLVYRPSRAWVVSGKSPVGAELESINRMVLELAGAVAAHLPTGVPTIGTPRELEWAISREIPSLVITDNAASWSLHDVPTCPLGDTAIFAKWLGYVESISWGEGAGSGSVGLQVVLDHEKAQLPSRSNPGDAGFDLYVSETTNIEPGEFMDVPCGLRVAMPYGVWGRITGRSSTLRKRHLLVAEGVIDTGYRGPLYAGVFNLGGDTCKIEQGERIAQLVLHQNIAPRFRTVSIDESLFDRIPGDSRGENGFGSSGS